MKILTLLITGLLTLPLMADETGNDEKMTEVMAHKAKEIERLLGDDWNVSVKANVIEMKSKFLVYHVALYGRSSMLPEFSDSTSLEDETEPEHYVIRLAYKMPLEQMELNKRREEQRKAADVLNLRQVRSDEYSEAAKKYSEIEIPRYESTPYQVYRYDSPESRYAKIYPPKSVKKIGAAKEILARIYAEIK